MLFRRPIGTDPYTGQPPADFVRPSENYWWNDVFLQYSLFNNTCIKYIHIDKYRIIWLLKISIIIHFFFFFFFLVYTMKGFEGRSFPGIRNYSFFSSSSGAHSPKDRDLTSTPHLFRASFYFIRVTSSIWFSLYFDMLWFFIISDSPLFLELYWHSEDLRSFSSSSFRFRSLENLLFRLFSRSFRIDFSYRMFYWFLILGRRPSVILNSEYFGFVLKFSVNPNFI